MVVFVTGVTGFIGRVFLDELLQHLAPSDVVRALVRAPFACADERVKVVHGDLLQCDKWLPAIEDVDWVFHLGGDATFGNGPHYQAVNVDSVRQMLQALAKSPNLKRFVLVSTVGAVDRKWNDPLQSALTPHTAPCPTSDYGRSKLGAEQLVRESGVPYTIVRPGWVYGAGMRERSHLKALAGIVSRFPSIAFVSFPGRVPLIHVRDLARSLVRCIHIRESADRTYIAATENRTLGDIVRLFQQMQRGPKGRQISVPLMRRVVGRLHAWLPFSLNVLFSDYLAVDDPRFREHLMPPSPILIESGCTDIVGASREAAGWWVVTGANSGIGRAITDALVVRQCPVIAVDRRTDDLHESESFRVIRADLTDPTDLERVVATAETVRIAALVNNAGVGFKGPFADTRSDFIEATVAVNVLAPLRLTHRLLPALMKSRSAIVNIASSVGYHPLPGMATYAATKAFTLSWSLALGDELRRTNHVITFSPSGTKTAFQSSGGVKGEGSAGLFDPREVAVAVLRAVDRRQRHCLMGWKSRVLVTVSRFLPNRMRLALWRTLFERMR